ncbi:Protein of unknown function [Aquiflexum balticum DSM 16537]|uniref:DUF2589 domain-containing protein n=1 Tax=Aquiflexum balticum DSM 16537 TaxID=758820 RepID=A0A1W2H7F0_9BACT|nr:DUF2589 domain-containing protein [Aquiflexum balticum]SMD44568.1 Protein of unknown function [Aquiflexum balticum DSM 16537]
MAEITFDPAEFKQVPLDFIISAPLRSTIEAHKLASITTIEFIRELIGMGNQKFERKIKKVATDNNGNTTTSDETKEILVPYLALTKVPNLNFDSLSVEFEYSISQIFEDKSKKEKRGDFKIGGSPFLAKFIDIGLSGSVSSSQSQENTINKSGKLLIKLHVSETGLPQGLEKVINWMVQGIDSDLEGAEQGG